VYRWLGAIAFFVLLLIPLGAQNALAGNAVCTSNSDCTLDEYCAKDIGAAPKDTGNCQNIPENCPTDIDPVCGTDGITYDNLCVAAQQRVNVAHNGKCMEVGGEFLSVDSTQMLVAGAQTFSWMIPVVLSVVGIGLFVVSRKSE